MEGIVFIVIAIWVINKVFKDAKKTKANAPGQAANPMSPGQVPPHRSIDLQPVTNEPRRATTDAVDAARAMIAKAAEAIKTAEAAGTSDFWKTPQGILNESDRAKPDLQEGQSRECDHGSIGGSLDITSHAGMGDQYVQTTPQVRVNVRGYDVPVAKSPTATAKTLNLTAQDMRQAVIMSEILKRPEERFKSRRCVPR